jgi:hypothetical protein
MHIGNWWPVPAHQAAGGTVRVAANKDKFSPLERLHPPPEAPDVQRASRKEWLRGAVCQCEGA